jgi:GDPmannose 4,6-dehydratase
LDKDLYLGNLDAIRDWGYAPEYVHGMWKMLQADSPEDFVLATGTSTTVLDFVRWAFDAVNLDWESHVRFDPRYLRPTEVDALIGDPGKAGSRLNWKSQTTPKALAELMVSEDLAKLAHKEGHYIDKVDWSSITEF